MENIRSGYLYILNFKKFNFLLLFVKIIEHTRQ